MAAGWVGGAVVVGVVGLLSQVRRQPRIEIAVEHATLHVTMHGWDVVYTLRRRISVPVAQVSGVAAVVRAQVPRTGMRLPGTEIPGLIRAGSFGTGRRRDFWDVRSAPAVLVIALAPGAPWRRLVLQVPDPDAEALRLQPVLGAWVGAL